MSDRSESHQAPTRPYARADRAAAIDQLGDRRAVDQPSHRIHTAEQGPAAGIALWVEPGAGGEPYLGTVKVAGENQRLFYQLVAACAQDAADRSFQRASFTIHDARLLRRLQRDFTIAPRPSGWEPNTGRAIQWDIEVDLTDALRQLARYV